MTHYQKMSKFELNSAFVTACKDGHLDKVAYLLTSPELVEHGNAEIYHNENLGFRWACQFGHLEIVKYLLTSPELKKNKIPFANIHVKEDAGFLTACTKGYLEIVSYLLTSPNITHAGHTHPEINVQDSEAINRACSNGHVALVAYLLTSPDLKNHSNIHSNHDLSFRNACVNEQLETVRYLIFDYSIDLTETLINFLTHQSNRNKLGNEAVVKMFQTRDSYYKFNNNLSHKSPGTKHFKI